MSIQLKCAECVRKQEEIYRLREELHRLKAKLHRQEQKSQVGYFGSATPSSKQPLKPNSKSDSPAKNGGAKPGHSGKGRQSYPVEQADRIEPITCDESICPECQAELKHIAAKNRSVLGMNTLKLEKIVYQLHRRRCPICKRVFSAQAPAVLPKFLINNELLTHIAAEHYVEGVPMGRLEAQLKLNNGTLFQAMHHLARLLEPVPVRLIQEYRQAAVKFADETGWRNDGFNGYAWLLSTFNLSIYRFRPTRASCVVTEVLGTDPLPGILVVDRYPGYNKAPCSLQYCYEHLRRPIQDLGVEFPNKPEVTDFVNTVVPLLNTAMGLRMQKISDAEFYQQAQQVKAQIIQVMQQPADHAAIQNIQAIFQENAHRLYHWAENRAVPAENNFSERGFRRLVISRKISFGSQSDAGAKTREILMTVLHSLRKRYPNDYRKKFEACLNEFAQNPKLDLHAFLFKSDGS